jgi:acyl-CoA dehydrogenase
MHTHLVAVPAWRWHNENAPVEGLLRRVANEQLVLVSTGASDWLNSGGTLTKVEGGYKYSGHKIFGSGSPAGNLLMTSGLYQDPADGPIVFHFPLPIDGTAVKVLDNWRALGMRGTGSNDVIVEDAFVPEAAAAARRKQGTYGILHLVAMLALPIVYSVYVGIAENARDLAVKQAMRRRDDVEVQIAVGEMETELRGAQAALDTAVNVALSAKPGPETTNDIVMLRTLTGQAAIRTVEKALEVVGGTAFYRSNGVERLWRDIQGARYHPVPLKKQHVYTGRIALGLPIE